MLLFIENIISYSKVLLEFVPFLFKVLFSYSVFRAVFILAIDARSNHEFVCLVFVIYIPKQEGTVMKNKVCRMCSLLLRC